MEGSYPTIDQPARIASSATVLTFISSADAHMVTYWGFRVAIRPVPSVDPSTPVAKSRKLFPSEKCRFDISFRSVEYLNMKNTIQNYIFKLLYLLTRDNLSTTTRFVETDRTDDGIYLPNVKMKGSVTFPHAQQLRVTFDSKTHTETDSDVLHLYNSINMRDENYLKYYNEAKRDESITTFSGEYNRIGHWVNLNVESDRLYFAFCSETVLEEMWGFKMNVTPLYKSILNPPLDLLDDLVNDGKMFRILEENQQREESSAVGLVLSNILQSEKIRSKCVSLYGVNWLHNLLVAGTDDVTIVALNALLDAPNVPSRSGLTFISDNMCVPKLIQLLGHDNAEIREMSLMFLNELFTPNVACLSIDTERLDNKYSTESVLLNIVSEGNIDELRFASDIIAKLVLAKKVDPDIVNGSNDASFGKKLMQHLKKIFVDNNKVESHLEVAFTLCTLMATENGISDFLSYSYDNIYSTSNSKECLETLLDMLVSAVKKQSTGMVRICLMFLSNLSQKSPYNIESYNLYRKPHGCISLMPNSFQVQQVMRPLWLDMNAPLQTSESSCAFDKNTGSQLLSPSSRRNGIFSNKVKNSVSHKRNFSSSEEPSTGSLSIGFWIRPSGFIDRDGLPIFYKGDFSGVLSPPRQRTTFRVASLVRHARVYYEVTLNSYCLTGNGCMFGWAKSEFPEMEAQDHCILSELFVGDDDDSYSFSPYDQKKYFSLLRDNGCQSYGTSLPPLKAGEGIGVLYDADTGVMSFTVNGNS